MKLLFLKIETTKELIKASSYEYQYLFMNFKITKTLKFLNFVIYQNSYFSK